MYSIVILEIRVYLISVSVSTGKRGLRRISLNVEEAEYAHSDEGVGVIASHKLDFRCVDRLARDGVLRPFGPSSY